MVKLPAFSGKKKSINLLPRDSFEASTLGVALEWALATGKWAVIVTQLVVMGAFLWRFGLDRKLTNLRREIAQQTAVVESYAQVEEEFLLTQKRVNHAKLTLEHQKTVEGMFGKFQNVTPSNVWYERLTVSPETVSVTAYATSLPGFSQLLNALQKDPDFQTVNVASIADGGTKGAQLTFDFTLTYAQKQGEEK